MEFIYDVEGNKEIVLNSIKKHGFATEHNYLCYLVDETDCIRNVFVRFDDDCGILARRSRNNVWYVMNEVLAPKEKRAELFLKFMDVIFKEKNARKVQVEFTKESREEMFDMIKDTNYRACALNYKLHWPVFNMKEWDGKLEGKKWKKLRYKLNCFRRDNKVEFKNVKDFSKEELKKVVDEWIETGAQIGAAATLIEAQGGTIVGIATINMDANDKTAMISGKYRVHTVWEA